MKTKDMSKGLKSVELKSATSGMGLPIYTALGSGKDSDGWLVYERVEHMYSDDDNIFIIEAEGPYVIEVYKLPMASNKSLPISYKGSGTAALGPFEAEGSITFKAKSSNAKQAGFIADVKDGITGETVHIGYMNINMETKELINEFDITETYELEGSGVYFIHITSNIHCEWEVEISQ